MGRRLKNFTLIEVTDEQRQVISGLYASVRTYTGAVVACRRCHHPTSRPSGMCSICVNSCEHPTTLNGYIVVRNGAHQPKSFCVYCGSVWGVTKGSTILDIELENRVDSAFVHPCARCGSAAGAEMHHWAPRAVFADADWWPVDYLCRECHRFWHQAMRRAGGYRLNNQTHIPSWEPTGHLPPEMVR